MCKEKGTSRKKEEAHPLSGSDQWIDNTLLTSGMPRVCLWMTHCLVLSLVALLSVNSMPKYKSYEMDQSNYELKHWTWTNTTKVTNTLLKL